MNNYIILAVVILFVFLLKNIKLIFHIKNNDYKENIENKGNYTKKKLLTDTELTFYNYFKKLDSQYIVLPQINLASIVLKKNSSITYQNELFRNIDFCIFNTNFEIILAIEINDDSHKNYKRKLRDEKVKKILKECNIELLTYNVNYPNTEDSVLERTNKVLDSIKNKSK